MIVYDVWAEWCPPCKKFAPVFERVSSRFPNVEFVKINADENAEFLNKFSIRSIPTILVADSSGNVFFQHAGIVQEFVLEEIVGRLSGG